MATVSAINAQIIALQTQLKIAQTNPTKNATTISNLKYQISALENIAESKTQSATETQLGMINAQLALANVNPTKNANDIVLLNAQKTLLELQSDDSTSSSTKSEKLEKLTTSLKALTAQLATLNKNPTKNRTQILQVTAQITAVEKEIKNVKSSSTTTTTTATTTTSTTTSTTKTYEDTSSVISTSTSADSVSTSIWSRNRVEGIQPIVIAPDSDGGVEFDALIQADMQLSATLPQYTVELGYVITDNIVLKPETMNLTLFLTDTPVTWVDRTGHGIGHTLDAIDMLRELYYKRQLFSVVTREAEYEDMFVTSISITKSTEIGYSRQVTMALQQVRTTEAQTVEIPETYGKALPEATGSSDTSTEETGDTEVLGDSETPADPTANIDTNTAGDSATPVGKSTSYVPTSNSTHTANYENISADVGAYCVFYQYTTNDSTQYYCVCYNNQNKWYRQNLVGYYKYLLKGAQGSYSATLTDATHNYGTKSGIWTNATTFEHFCAGGTYKPTVSTHYSYAYYNAGAGRISPTSTKKYDINGEESKNGIQASTLILDYTKGSPKACDSGKTYKYFVWARFNDIESKGIAAFQSAIIQPISNNYTTKFAVASYDYKSGSATKSGWFFGTISDDGKFYTLKDISPALTRVKAFDAWASHSNRNSSTVAGLLKTKNAIYVSSNGKTTTFSFDSKSGSVTKMTVSSLKDNYKSMSSGAKKSFITYITKIQPELSQVSW